MNHQAWNTLSWQLVLVAVLWVVFLIVLARAVSGRKRAWPVLGLLTVDLALSVALTGWLSAWLFIWLLPCAIAVVSLSVLISARRCKRSRLALGLASLSLALSPFLLLVLVGTGYMLSDSLTVRSAAHQGVRAAALGKDVTIAVDNSLAALRTSTVAGQPGYRTVTTEYMPHGSSAWSTVAPSPITSNYSVRVTVTYDAPPRNLIESIFRFIHDSVTGLNGLSVTEHTLTGQAVMRYGG